MSAFRIALILSKRCPAGTLRGAECHANKIAANPSGTFARNNHCQDATDRIAAAIDGPAAEQTATVSVMTDIPAPRRSGGNTSRTNAELTLMMPAAPNAWAARQATNRGSESARPQQNEANVNRQSPDR